MKRVALVMAAAALCAAAPAADAQDAERGAALLAQARNAIGGEARLGAVKTLDVQGDFKRMAGQTTIEGELQVRVERPDKLRRDEDLSLPGGGPAIVRTEVLNGAAVWDENSGGQFFTRLGRGDGGGGGDGGGRGSAARGRAAMDPARLEDAQRRARQAELARFLLIWLLQVDGPVSWVATAESPDGRADVLEIASASGPPVRLFLDQASHMPLMLTWQGNAPQLVLGGRRGARGGRGAPGGDSAPGDGPPANRPPATLQITLSEYKTVDGLRLPHLVTRGANDTTLEEWTIDRYRINSSFRADVFAR